RHAPEVSRQPDASRPDVRSKLAAVLEEPSLVFGSRSSHLLNPIRALFYQITETKPGILLYLVHSSSRVSPRSRLLTFLKGTFMAKPRPSPDAVPGQSESWFINGAGR